MSSWSQSFFKTRRKLQWHDLNRNDIKVYTILKRKRVTNLEDAIHDLNSESRPFSNYHQHIFQNEAWYLSIPMKSSLIYMWMKTYNHVKGWALGLAFKKKPKLIQKWVFNNYENYFKNTLTKPSQDTNLGSNQGIIEISNFFFYKFFLYSRITCTTCICWRKLLITKWKHRSTRQSI